MVQHGLGQVHLIDHALVVLGHEKHLVDEIVHDDIDFLHGQLPVLLLLDTRHVILPVLVDVLVDGGAGVFHGAGAPNHSAGIVLILNFHVLLIVIVLLITVIIEIHDLILQILIELRTSPMSSTYGLLLRRHQSLSQFLSGLPAIIFLTLINKKRLPLLLLYLYRLLLPLLLNLRTIQDLIHSQIVVHLKAPDIGTGACNAAGGPVPRGVKRLLLIQNLQQLSAVNVADAEVVCARCVRVIVCFADAYVVHALSGTVSSDCILRLFLFLYVVLRLCLRHGQHRVILCETELIIKQLLLPRPRLLLLRLLLLLLLPIVQFLPNRLLLVQTTRALLLDLDNCLLQLLLSLLHEPPVELPVQGVVAPQ